MMVRLEGGLLLSFCFHVLNTKRMYLRQQISQRSWRKLERTESHREKVFHFLEQSANHGTRSKDRRLYLHEFNA